MTVPPSRVSRTTSSSGHSETSTTAPPNNGWQVPDPGVTLGTVGGKSGLAEQAPLGDHAHAEHELSSLYVSAERAAMNDIDKHLTRGKQRQGWASSLVNSAVSATVFGAAVGLTAYRLWSGWRSNEDEEDDSDDEHDEHDELHDGGETSKTEDRLVQSDHSEPPPAYDTILDGASTIASSSPAASVASPLRRRRKRRIKRPSIAELILATKQQELGLRSPPTRPGSTRASSPEPSLPSPTFLSLTPGHTPHKKKRGAAPEPIEEEDESDDERMSVRLDDMARRIQSLIDDGQRALHSSPSLPPAEPIPLLSVTPNAAPSDDFGSWMDNGRMPRRASVAGTNAARNRMSMPVPSPSQQFARDGPRHSAPIINTAPGSPTPSSTQHTQTHSRIPSYHGSVLSRSPRPAKTMPAPTLYGGGTAPPLPWRRERVGSNKWIQRPPSPTLGQLAANHDPGSMGSDLGGSFDFGSLSSSNPSHPGTPVHGTWSGSASRPLASPGAPLEPPAYLRPASPAAPSPQTQTHTPTRSRIPRFDHARTGSTSSRPGSAASTVGGHQRSESAALRSRPSTPASTPKAPKRQRSGTTDGTPTRPPPRSFIPSRGMPSIKPGTVAQRRLSFTKSPSPSPTPYDMQ